MHAAGVCSALVIRCYQQTFAKSLAISLFLCVWRRITHGRAPAKMMSCEKVELRTAILQGFAACFTDYRDPESIAHSVFDLVPQRSYGLCLGYENFQAGWATICRRGCRPVGALDVAPMP